MDYETLCRDYAESLPALRAQTLAAWHRLLESDWAPETFVDFHRLIHHLAGTGGSFGFPSISEASLELEQLLRDQETSPLPEARRHLEGRLALLLVSMNDADPG